MPWCKYYCTPYQGLSERSELSPCNYYVGNFIVGAYRYLNDLLALEEASQSPMAIDLPECCNKIVTPLKWENWNVYLNRCPDKQFISFILRGIRQGFHIGCNYSKAVILSSPSNMPAALAHPEIVFNYLQRESELHRIFLVLQRPTTLSIRLALG